jgi:predicted nucleic acid-binding Zn ribbon protein
LGDALERYLEKSGLADRLAQASVVEEWSRLVGERVARVCQPESVSRDGTLFVRVASGTWMQELQLLTPEILERLRAEGKKIGRIVWRAA